jgi:hypothetical protein
VIQIEISWRRKMVFIAACYAAILLFAAAVMVHRHYLALRYPNDFNGGMAAAGDGMLDLLIAIALLVPTFLLALAVRQRETASVIFAKVLFGFSLTAPLSLALLSISAISLTNNVVGFLCMYRLLASPVVCAGIGTSRLLACYRPAKRLITYALLIEIVTLVLGVADFFLR